MTIKCVNIYKALKIEPSKQYTGNVSSNYLKTSSATLEFFERNVEQLSSASHTANHSNTKLTRVANRVLALPVLSVYSFNPHNKPVRWVQQLFPFKDKET